VVALYLFLFRLPNLSTNILTLLYDNFSFWTLTANPDAYRHQAALDLAEEKGLTPEGVRRGCSVLDDFYAIPSNITSPITLSLVKLFQPSLNVTIDNVDFSSSMLSACPLEFPLWMGQPMKHI